MQNLSDDFLYDRMVHVVMDGSVEWSLKLVVAAVDDEVGDPTVPWLEERTELLLGRIQINLPDAQAGSLRRVFDPAQMPQGVDAPLDQGFELRSVAYAESYHQRGL
ncbi:catalase, putative [Roseobacter sp. SK209-2-6]|nr:catalase, putative [Roseobacter sp. SK209-2-6]